MKSYPNDPALLRTLKAQSRVSYLSQKKRKDRIPKLAKIGPQIGAAREKMRPLDTWPEAMAFIIRDKPDDRGIVSTILPNEDAMAVLLAIRAGINEHMAVALAHADMIHAHRLNNNVYAPHRFEHGDGVVLATFRERDRIDVMIEGLSKKFGVPTAVAERASDWALFAHKDTGSFVSPFRSDELWLLDQHPEKGLFEPAERRYWNEDLAYRYPAMRTDEIVYYDCDGDEHDADPEAVQ